MKLSYIIPIAAGLLGMSACGHDDDKTWPDKQLTIAEQYMPVSMTFQSTDQDTMQLCRDLNQKVFIVNSKEQLPADPIGYSPSFEHLDLQYHTLLITYRLHVWDVETYTNTYVRSYAENCYKWYIRTGISYFYDEGDTKRNFTRYAILVSKIPDNTDVKAYWQESIADWDWDWD